MIPNPCEQNPSYIECPVCHSRMKRASWRNHVLTDRHKCLVTKAKLKEEGWEPFYWYGRDQASRCYQTICIVSPYGYAPKSLHVKSYATDYSGAGWGKPSSVRHQRYIRKTFYTIMDSEQLTIGERAVCMQLPEDHEFYQSCYALAKLTEGS